RPAAPAGAITCLSSNHVKGMSDAGSRPTSAVQRSEQRPEGVETMDVKTARARRDAPLGTPTDLSSNATQDVSAALNVLLADMFALYMKTKNFHWHMSGPHFRDYHLLLDEQGEQIFATTDDLAERVRKIGGLTLRSIGHVARLQRVKDNDAEFVTPQDMLAELRDDNKDLAARMLAVHELCDEYNDVATASLLENWIDEAERRTWFLYEATRRGNAGD
ncbi:MAG TPA: DNA starvation/stationary phase protection protein, partial [Rhizomicrobium sp.]|nr:DNA starvation/stationary phase protection protein [Rhizomicrobium sp.]